MNGTPSANSFLPGKNSSFSSLLPTLQLAWDSTSLGALKECPRKYYLSIVCGWQLKAQSVHLTFGLHYHAALERYDHAKVVGASHEAAIDVAVAYTLEATWDRELGRPWVSDHQSKNRLTLLRTVVWYLDQFKEDPFQTVVLASSGKPAVELSFRLATTHYAPTGEAFLLCGHLDRVAHHDSGIYIMDRKTSTSTLSQDFFSKFAPDNQMSCYTLAGQIIYELPIKGIVIDAAQVAVTFSRFQRGLIERHEASLGEWYMDLGLWLGQATVFAQMSYWPMNDKSCGNYGGCSFRGICAKPPSVREQWLRSDFSLITWDPLKVRGDI